MIAALKDYLRKNGGSKLYDPNVCSRLFDKAMQTNVQNLLGHQLMGAPQEIDDIYIRYTAYEPPKGYAKAVDLKSKAYEIPKGGSKSEVFGTLRTAETCSFDHEELTCLEIAKRRTCTDAKIAQAANIASKAFNTLASRYTILKEKTFWEGAMGTMTIDIHNNAVPMVIGTGTTTLPALTGTNVWSAPATATPLDDIKAAEMQFRGTGFRPRWIVMNQITYNAYKATNQFTGALGPNLTASYYFGGFEPDRVGQSQVVVYDEYYVDEAGVTHYYVPDGKVVYIGEGGVNPVELFECINVDGCGDGNAYGSFFDVLCDENPKQLAYYHSCNFGPVFAYPKAFISQQVF